MKVPIKLLKHGAQITKYLTVGGLTAAIYFSILFITFDFLDLSKNLSVTTSYFVSTAFHFAANKLFTFASHGKNFAPQIARYLCVVFINYLITMLVVFIIVDLCGLSPYAGVAVAVAVTVALGYGMTKFWVFQQDGIGRG